jgi:hypothetical protein
MVVVSVAAIRGAALWPTLRTPLIAAMGLTLLIQVGGQGLFSLKYAQRIVADETRADFLHRTVPGFAAVAWINDNLPPGAHLMSTIREIVYLIDAPTFMAHPIYQMEVELRGPGSDPGRRWRQIRKKKLTHVLSIEGGFMETLERLGCAETLKKFQVPVLESRTLPTLRARQETWALIHLTPATCTLAN